MNFVPPAPVPEDPKPRKVPLAERWCGFPIGLVLTVLSGLAWLALMGVFMFTFVVPGENLKPLLMIGATVSSYWLGALIGGNFMFWRIGDPDD